MNNVAEHTKLVQEMASGIKSKNDSIVIINQVNCGTHVFQLAVNEALQKSNSAGIIHLVHDMCNLMRSQIVMIEIRKLGNRCILPPMDNATRWNSKYLMVILYYKSLKWKFQNVQLII